MLEHKTVSLADQVFEHIEEDILSGKYPRGAVLTETKLSTELGVSRTPIREALRRLRQEHLIEESGKGSVVIGITEKDLRDIFLVRRNVEGMAVSSAAKCRTEEQLKEIRETVELQEFYVAKHDADQIKRLDNRFHRLLYKASGSNVFLDVLMPLHKKIQKYRRAAVANSSRAAASVAEHRAVYDAIAAGDAALAEKLTTEHIHNAYHYMIGDEK